MKAVEIQAAEFGQVRSRKDHSVSCTFITPELRPSEAGALIALHGLAVRITIIPHDVEPEETVTVEAELGSKTPSQRLRGCLFVLWKSQNCKEPFSSFYERSLEGFINSVKYQLPE